MTQPQKVEDSRALEEFYAASYGKLVQVLASVTGNTADAEEVVQEAFARLVPRWAKVCRYDHPEAWVRQVAVRLAISRWRRRSAAGAAHRLSQAPAAVPGPDESRVDVEAVLSGLSLSHRAVLVLHHGIGLPLEQVAHELNIPVGTVKSRLSRARAAFQSAYAPAEGADHA